MHTYKHYLAAFAGIVVAGAAVVLHVIYVWPAGLQSVSKSERDLMTLEPGLETCAVFFAALRRTSNLVARRLGAIGPKEELIHDTHGNIVLTEILAAVLVIMFRGIVPLYPGPMTFSDGLMVVSAAVNLLVNIREAVRSQRHA